MVLTGSISLRGRDKLKESCRKYSQKFLVSNLVPKEMISHHFTAVKFYYNLPPPCLAFYPPFLSTNVCSIMCDILKRKKGERKEKRREGRKKEKKREKEIDREWRKEK